MWTLALYRLHAVCGAAILSLAAGGHAVEVLPPAGALTNPVAVLAGVSCATITSCASGGQYDNAFGGNAMVANGSSSRWARASQVRLPADAEASPDAAVGAVSCTGGGSACVAVGAYTSAPAGARAGLIASRSRGRWGRAIKPKLPANARMAASASLLGVSCPRAGSCVSVGIYVDTSNNTQGMAVSQARGRWGRATEIIAPRGSGPNPDFVLRAVACTAPGTCTAVGTYIDRLSKLQGAVATESNGRWSRAVTLPVPAGALASPDVVIGGVACTSRRWCVVSGAYRSPPSLREAMIVTESGGRWHAIRISPPNSAGVDPVATLASVACARTGSCVAAGTYDTASMQQAAMRASESGGRWHQAATVSLPRGAATGAQAESQLFAVTCVPRRACIAVGNYLTSGRNLEAMAVTLPPP